jgi:hypothetical protein
MMSKSPGWTLKKCFFLTMGGFVYEVDSGEEKTQKRLLPKDLYHLFRDKKLPWPEVEDKEIADRSKSDWFLKSLALVQVLWFVTQILGRAAQGLVVTTLELFTLGIVFCAIWMYALLWEQPFDVRQPIIIPDNTNVTSSSTSFRCIGLNDTDVFAATPWYHHITILVFVVFGGLHVVAWQFHFPTNAEQWMWRISSILSTICPVIMVLGVYYLDKEWSALTIVLAILYTTVRLYMFVEMFVSLRAVPASAYRTPEWSQYFPTFG